jgi:hypothetical protein
VAFVAGRGGDCPCDARGADRAWHAGAAGAHHRSTADAGADRSAGLAAALAAVAAELGCSFFDAGAVVATSDIDGVHLDRDACARLGRALVEPVEALV